MAGNGSGFSAEERAAMKAAAAERREQAKIDKSVERRELNLAGRARRDRGDGRTGQGTCRALPHDRD